MPAESTVFLAFHRGCEKGTTEKGGGGECFRVRNNTTDSSEVRSREQRCHCVPRTLDAFMYHVFYLTIRVCFEKRTFPKHQVLLTDCYHCYTPHKVYVHMCTLAGNYTPTIILYHIKSLPLPLSISLLSPMARVSLH